ncbi:NADH-quinone oxidoreductase subunit J [Segetibacter sp.]|jgi:NADH-quinone oxidoreductase subunit J|uniref:NADH-quinone oxidoreductase subunit J family protein n=1 Tax=Segetibacter sp. TaxID=2231182 RepID=UPI002609B5A1|nr:NADH-quinone oxidoreductase subunit J [Segetibacter sp.]MCW3080224.1 NADH-ubiquinone/plastoquinone oxidoreductase chain 6 [Segetibacter sp.]
MTASQIIFYTISAFILGSGLLSVTSTKIFRSAIWLLFSLVGIAGLYFWMQVEFVAAVQIIVYVGGIVVLIIFSIFLTQESGKEMPKPSMRKTIFSVLAALFGFAFTYNLIDEYGFPIGNAKPFNVAVSDIGTQMLSTTDFGYILPFEVVSMLLLASMIGCIVIAMKTPEHEPGEPKEVMLDNNEDAPAPTVVIIPSVPEPLIIAEV